MTTPLLPRIAARLSAPDDSLDQTLLGRFVAERDGVAFAALVARHGPMVLAVCRRILGNAIDADDAFQATFLVLVRRAGDVRHQDRLAGWLYGVAYRTAVEARRRRAKRFSRETPTGELPDMPVESPTPDLELSVIVEQELSRLPDHYRLAIALCDLDGRSRKEAAELLGIPEGTLSSRLNTGRRLLSVRFTRSGYSTGSVLPEFVAVPGPLLDATVAAVIRTPDSNILSLSNGVLRTMSRNWKVVKWGLPALAVVVMIGSGVVAAVQPTPANSTPKANAVRKIEDTPGDKNVSDAPPVVVKTVPAAGAEDVDPTTKEVSVTFSKAMTDGSWSWAQDLSRGASLPSGDNKPAFTKDKKTCSLAVKLEPNTTYAVWLNGGEFMNFKDADGTSSLPYLLVFRTSKGK